MALNAMFNTLSEKVSGALEGRKLADWRRPETRGAVVARALHEETRDIDRKELARLIKRDAGTPGILNQGYVKALCRAIERGMPDVAEQLIEAGVPADAKCEGESRLDPVWSPLQSAVENGRPDMLKMLLAHSPADILKTTETALVWYAVASKHSEMLLPLFSGGADPDKPKIYDSLSYNATVYDGSSYSATPLVRAISDGKHDVIDALLDAGASAQLASDSGNTPLHQAVWSMDAKTCAKLLDKGADIEAKDISGRTPMQCAAYCQLPSDGTGRIIEVVKLLAQRGANMEGIAETARLPEVQAAMRDIERERKAFTSGAATEDMSLAKKITASKPVHFKPK